MADFLQRECLLRIFPQVLSQLIMSFLVDEQYETNHQVIFIKKYQSIIINALRIACGRLLLFFNTEMSIISPYNGDIIMSVIRKSRFTHSFTQELSHDLKSLVVYCLGRCAYCYYDLSQGTLDLKATRKSSSKSYISFISDDTCIIWKNNKSKEWNFKSNTLHSRTFPQKVSLLANCKTFGKQRIICWSGNEMYIIQKNGSFITEEFTEILDLFVIKKEILFILRNRNNYSYLLFNFKTKAKTEIHQKNPFIKCWNLPCNSFLIQSDARQHATNQEQNVIFDIIRIDKNQIFEQRLYKLKRNEYCEFRARLPNGDLIFCGEQILLLTVYGEELLHNINVICNPVSSTSPGLLFGLGTLVSLQ